MQGDDFIILICLTKRGQYRSVFVIRDELILFSVKREFSREFRKLLFVTRNVKVLRDSWPFLTTHPCCF